MQIRPPQRKKWQTAPPHDSGLPSSDLVYTLLFFCGLATLSKNFHVRPLTEKRTIFRFVNYRTWQCFPRPSVRINMPKKILSKRIHQERRCLIGEKRKQTLGFFEARDLIDWRYKIMCVVIFFVCYRWITALLRQKAYNSNLGFFVFHDDKSYWQKAEIDASIRKWYVCSRGWKTNYFACTFILGRMKLFISYRYNQINIFFASL